MKRGFQTAGALVLTLAVATAASADTAQLAASAGIAPDVAASYSLTEIAVARYNAGVRRDDRIAVASAAVVADPVAHAQLFAAAGVSPAAGMTLTDLAAAKRNREARGDDAGRSFVPGSSGGSAQLIASVGIAPEVGRSMSLNEIYLEKIVRQSDDD